MDSGSYSADTQENEAKPPVTDDGIGQKQRLPIKYKNQQGMGIRVNLFCASDECVEGGNEEEDRRKGAADEQSMDESAECRSEKEDRHQLDELDERSVEEESEEEDCHQLPIEARKFLAEEEVATVQTMKRLNEEYNVFTKYPSAGDRSEGKNVDADVRAEEGAVDRGDLENGAVRPAEEGDVLVVDRDNLERQNWTLFLNFLSVLSQLDIYAFNVFLDIMDVAMNLHP